MGAWACAHDLCHMIPGQQGRLVSQMKTEKLREERLSRKKTINKQLLTKLRAEIEPHAGLDLYSPKVGLH